MNKKIICAVTLVAILFSGLFFTMQNPSAAGYVKSTKINSCTSYEAKKMKISWNKVSNADGYQIKIARDKNFNKVVSTINTSQKYSTKLSGFVNGRGYYVKMRAYDKVKNKKYYSKWSSVKWVKIHEHSYKLVKQNKSTCKNGGRKDYKCNCGSKYSTYTKKLSHKYNKTINNNEAIYKCVNCGYKYVEKIKEDMSVDKNYTIKLQNGTTTTFGHFDEKMAEEILKLTNEYRSKNGLDKLKEGSNSLQEAANIRAYEISKDFSHTRPNGERALTSFNSKTDCCAENIGKYQKTAKEVVQGWINSPGHNSNLLKKDAEALSVGVFAEKQQNGNYYYHFVQFFGW